MYDNEIRKRLRMTIDLGNIVIIFDYDNLDIMQLLSQKLVSKNIFNVEIWQSIDKKSNIKLSKYVSKAVIDKVINLYCMYDFSDKVFVISDTNQYGNIFNYIKTGILTRQEMVDALLYKT